MTTTRTCHGWAIDSRSREGHGLLGILFFNSSLCEPLPVVRTALFPTRAAAREQVRREKTCSYQPFPDMRPVRVRITVEVDE